MQFLRKKKRKKQKTLKKAWKKQSDLFNCMHLIMSTVGKKKPDLLDPQLFPAGDEPDPLGKVQLKKKNHLWFIMKKQMQSISWWAVWKEWERRAELQFQGQLEQQDLPFPWPQDQSYIYTALLCANRGFPLGSVVKNLPASAGDAGLISGSVRSSGGGNGNPLQYSPQENSLDRGAWRATRVTKESDMT